VRILSQLLQIVLFGVTLVRVLEQLVQVESVLRIRHVVDHEVYFPVELLFLDLSDAFDSLGRLSPQVGPVAFGLFFIVIYQLDCLNETELHFWFFAVFYVEHEPVVDLPLQLVLVIFV